MLNGCRRALISSETNVQHLKNVSKEIHLRPSAKELQVLWSQRVVVNDGSRKYRTFLTVWERKQMVPEVDGAPERTNFVRRKPWVSNLPS